MKKDAADSPSAPFLGFYCFLFLFCFFVLMLYFPLLLALFSCFLFRLLFSDQNLSFFSNAECTGKDCSATICLQWPTGDSETIHV